MNKTLDIPYHCGLALFWSVFAWSGIAPKDYSTWILEVLPAFAGILLVIATRRFFPLSPLAYWLIIAHAIVLTIGGHYTYAEVPLFDLLKEFFDSTRNNYDKLGHFMQGFEPAITAREILIRNEVLRKPKWLDFVIVCICLALSSVYEMLEWMAALFSSDGAEAFLGTQGYVWDTQSDMAFALAGAMLALTALKRAHDRQLARMRRPAPQPCDNSP